MTDTTTTKFDPIPRLQQIAATIREVGGIADIAIRNLFKEATDGK